MTNAIIFDLDGTIIDSEPAAARAIQKVLNKRKIVLKADNALFGHGMKWEIAVNQIINLIEQKYPNQRENREEIETEILTVYREDLESHLPTVEGVIEALQLLSDHFPIALVSGSPRQDILWALDRLEIKTHFRFVLGAEDYSLSKPAPDGYLKAASLLGFKPEKILVFEDSVPGIISALTAGTRVVAVTSTNYHGQDLSKAHIQIKDFSKITKDWVRKVLKPSTE